ncbi:MAG: seg [archaeon GW2011_AR5]|nr:MAG: seg [archaeon GW2011_AR5]MBS3051129.1 hypothetical protein [Candidatus Aenigmarchaeota archaeon]
MQLETQIDVLETPLSVISMLEEISSSSGVSEFEFVGYVPGSEYDFTTIVGTATLGFEAVRKIGADKIGRYIIGTVYVNTDDGEDLLGRLAVGLSSRTPAGHLPQIDFCCRREDVELVYDFLRELNLDGYVLFSGRSYHFQGSKPVEESGWQEFMRNLGEDCSIVDFDWQSECMENGYSVLRITDAQNKPYVPEVVAKVSRTLKYEGQMSLPFELNQPI